MSSLAQPLLTDFYQVSMAYSYWKSGKSCEIAVFELFFRENPFEGEFTIFAGLENCLRLLERFRYSDSDIEYLKTVLPISVESVFYTYLKELTLKDIKFYAVPEGSVVFPRVPVICVEGPLPIIQLLETPLLTLVNYASLVATNAARYRMATGPDVQLFEFGLRRAQGPDGGLSASVYTYIGGFDGTSNVLAGKMFGIPVKGTQAHSFVMSFFSIGDCKLKVLKNKNGNNEVDLMELCKKHRSELYTLLKSGEANDSELASFVAYAVSYPDNFQVVIDTYDVIRSGLLNFCAVALSLNDLGYKALGVRIDSGDLSYLSKVSRETFKKIANAYSIAWFGNLLIVVSNRINEDILLSLKKQGHAIDCFGVGTHLVTCQKQPALGCVFKLVEVNSRPCMKLSANIEKVTIPGRKFVYRLFNEEGDAVVDLMQLSEEVPPKTGVRLLVRHPFKAAKRAYVQPYQVQNLHELCFDQGKICIDLPSLQEIRQKVKISLDSLRVDVKRHLNPTPYKVSVSNKLYNFMNELWLQSAPVGELH